VFDRIRKLREVGVLGINRRNADYTLVYNPRRLYPLVDDKLQTKHLALGAGMAVPELYGVISHEYEIKRLPELLAPHASFVIKPAHGSGGNGIVVVTGRMRRLYRKAGGLLVSPEELAYHVSNTLSGLYSLGGYPDQAIIEYRVQFDPVFEAISYQGVPDIRIIVFLGVPVLAMVRLPTRASEGKANLHQGAIGVAGIHEKFLTLELAYALRDRIQRAHPEVRVVMTRYWDTDVGLTERIEMANQLDADLFLSLHYNAAVHPRALGFETYFLVASEATPGKAQVRGKPVATASMKITGITNTVDDHPTQGTYHQTIVTIERDLARERQHRDSGLLARVVQQQLNRQLHSVNRGVKQANFAVLRGALMPAVVVESAFLTHPEEGRKLTHAAHRARVSTALLRAIETFDRDLTERSR